MARAEEFIRRRGLEGRVEPISPKLALPIVENASVEEDDDLQDLWVRLLVAAADPDKRGRAHVAFIDVIRQLEPPDAKLLNYVHERAHEELDRSIERMSDIDQEMKKSLRSKLLVSNRPISAVEVQRMLNLTKSNYQLSVDNLMRQRCLKSYVEQETIDVMDGFTKLGSSYEITKDHQYDSISITLFGCSFVETCMADDAG